MAQPAVLTRLTYEDFLGFPDDGRRHELIDGDHYVSPAPKTKHQLIVTNLVWQLRSYLAEQPIGRVLVAPTDIVLSDWDVVEPDVLFVASDRLEIITEDNLTAAPDLVVEVLSESTRRRDEITKRHLYERFGVREYWLVDPETNTVRIFRRNNHKLELELSVEEGGEITSPLLPGLAISVHHIFE